MTPKEYLTNWTGQGDKLIALSKQKLIDLNLQASTISYLEVGLPEDAAPYILFVNNSNDLYEGVAKLEDQYDLDLEPDKYIVIGSDGSGNPIAVNIKNNDTIEWLDHEDYFESSYCNNSLASLLNFLIIYRDFVNEIISANGDDALLDANFTDEQFDYMKERMLTVDSTAVNQLGFWKEELEMLIANREHYRTNP